MSLPRPVRVDDWDPVGDGAAVLSLNNAAEPNVNALGADELATLAGLGQLRVVRDETGVPVALALTMRDGQAYASSNYRWFGERHAPLLYVDRVVVAPGWQGRGLARALYEDAVGIAVREGLPRICAEVNVDPPNPGSTAFHSKLGFQPIEERLNEQSGKTVAMLVRPITEVDRAAWLGSRQGQTADVSQS